MTCKDKGSYESSPPCTVPIKKREIARVGDYKNRQYTNHSDSVRTLYFCRYTNTQITLTIHEYTITLNGEAVWALRSVCCSVLQCFAVCCSVLQCVAVCCSVLQCVAVCCSVLQSEHLDLPQTSRGHPAKRQSTHNKEMKKRVRVREQGRESKIIRRQIHVDMVRCVDTREGEGEGGRRERARESAGIWYWEREADRHREKERERARERERERETERERVRVWERKRENARESFWVCSNALVCAITHLNPLRAPSPSLRSLQRHMYIYVYVGIYM